MTLLVSFSILFFSLYSVYYTEVEERWKWGRPGNTYHVNDVRWTSGGRERGRVCIQITYRLHRWALSRLARPQTFTRSWVLCLTGKTPTLRFISHLLVVGDCPPYVYLASTWHHLCDECSQAFPDFCCSSTSVYYTERKPKNKNRGGLGTRLRLYQW